MDLVFRESDHSFWLGDRRLPSTTQILKHFIPRFQCDEWYLERGKAVHKATELYDKGTLDPESVDPQIEGYVQAWIKFREDYLFEPGSIELQAYHPVYMYAGILDRLGMSEGKRVLLDIKSGEPSKSDRLQIAGGYYSMVMPGVDICYPLYLHADGTYDKPRPYSPKEIREAQNVWLCFVTGFNYLLRENIIGWGEI